MGEGGGGGGGGWGLLDLLELLTSSVVEEMMKALRYVLQSCVSIGEHDYRAWGREGW